MAVKKISHGRKSDMWMRTHIKRIAITQNRWPHSVKKDKRPDKATANRGKRTPHLQPSNITRQRNHQRFDGIHSGLVAKNRIRAWKETHRATTKLKRTGKPFAGA
ncbi:hypothetical protein D9M69_724570 [compost metagenome]